MSNTAVQKEKIRKARAKRASGRNAKRGVTNTFKENIIHNLPYGLDKVPLRVGVAFAKTMSLAGRSYVQKYVIVDIVYQSKETGEYFENLEDVPEGMEVAELPVTAAKTAVRL